MTVAGRDSLSVCFAFSGHVLEFHLAEAEGEGEGDEAAVGVGGAVVE